MTYLLLPKFFKPPPTMLRASQDNCTLREGPYIGQMGDLASSFTKYDIIANTDSSLNTPYIALVPFDV